MAEVLAECAEMGETARQVGVVVARWPRSVYARERSITVRFPHPMSIVEVSSASHFTRFDVPQSQDDEAEWVSVAAVADPRVLHPGARDFPCWRLRRCDWHV